MWYTCPMRQIISTRTYRAMYRLLDRVSPVAGDCGRFCGSICCTIENPKSSDNILLQHREEDNKQTPYKMLDSVNANADDRPAAEGPEDEEEQVLGIYLYPGEESLFLQACSPASANADPCGPTGDAATPVFRKRDGTPQFLFETEDAEEYEYPDSWTGRIWFAHCLCAPHCERAVRPLQCRFYPVAPHIDRRGELTLIWFPGASAGADEVPYQCPLIEQRMPLMERFLKATYTVCRHLLRDPQIYDLFLFDAAWRREDPDFDEDNLRVYP